MAGAEPLHFFRAREELTIWGNRLPHWQQAKSVVFVTFRLVDSVPQALLAPWQRLRDIWRSRHPPPWTEEQEREYHRRISVPFDRWLDLGHGECVLRRTVCAQAVAEVLRFDDERNACRFLAWVIMPNHVHLVCVPRAGAALDELIKSWKGVSARRINRLLGRCGPLWQRDYFDRLVRDQAHLARCVRYMRRNPEKAGLDEGEYLSFESEVARGIE